MAFTIGQIIAEKYEVISVLGFGASSEVYKVKDVTTGNIYALKLLHDFLLEKPGAKSRFEQEARAIMLLAHKNIVKLIGSGEIPKARPYILMDYIDGQTLADILKEKNFISINRALGIFLQIATALSHAHTKGVIHRNIKPSNILLTKQNIDEIAVVADFGLAKLLPSSGEEIKNLTKKGSTIGSPLFMSPEQCIGKTVDERSDIYSLGCLMYACLVGKPPIKGATVMDTMSRHINEQPLSFAAVCPELDLSVNLESIVFKAMAKNPDKRYKSMDDLAQDLLRFRDGEEPYALFEHNITKEESCADKVNESSKTVKWTNNKYFLVMAFSLVLILVFAIYFVVLQQNKINKQISENNKKSIEEFTSSLLRSPQEMNGAAKSLFLDGQMEEAAKLYESSIKVLDNKKEKGMIVDQAELAKAHFGLAETLMSQSKFKEAEKEILETLETALKDKKVESVIHQRDMKIRLSECLREEGKSKEAYEIFVQLTKSDNRETRCLGLEKLIRLAFQNNNKKEADIYIKKMLLEITEKQASQGLFSNYILFITQMYLDTNNASDAEKILLDLIDKFEKEESHSFLVFNLLNVELARIYCSQSKYEQAISLCQRSRKYLGAQGSLDGMISIDQLLAAIATLKGNLSEAMNLFEQAEISTNDAGEYIQKQELKALSLSYAGKSKEALDELAKIVPALHVRYGHKLKYLAVLAQIYLSAGKAEMALAAADESLFLQTKYGLYPCRNYVQIIKAQALKNLGKEAEYETYVKKFGPFPPTNLSTHNFDYLMPKWIIYSELI